MRFFKSFLLGVLLVSGADIFAAKLTDQPALTTPAAGDVIHVVDISDVTSGAAGTSKQSQLGDVGKLFKANKTVIVNVLSDLPAASGGVIVLDASTNYVLGDSVDLGTNRIDVSAGNISWTSNHIFGPTLTYTGTGSLFTGVDFGTFNIFQTRIDASNDGELFNLSDSATPGVSVVLIDSVDFLRAGKLGTFNDLLFLGITNSGGGDIDDGVTLAGSNWLFITMTEIDLESTSATFVGIDFGTAISDAFNSRELLFVAPAGAIGISGLTNSGNISAGRIATLRDSNFSGGMTGLSGLSPDDIRWAFSFNGGIQDTTPDAMVSLNNNATETVITVTGTPVKVAGTFVAERGSHYTGDTTGRITYNGERPITTPVDIVVTLKSAGGTNKDVEAFLALNGAVISNSGKTNRVGQNDPKNVSVVWQLSLTQNDFLEVFVANNTDTVNLVVVDAILRAR